MSTQDVREIFQALDDVSPLRRSKAIEELRMSVNENNGHLLFGHAEPTAEIVNPPAPPSPAAPRALLCRSDFSNRRTREEGVPVGD